MPHLAAMAGDSRLDDRGRITIRPEFRDTLGDRIVQILTPRGVLLRRQADRLTYPNRLPSALEASGEDQARKELE